MKIPVLDEPNVAPKAKPTPYSNLNFDTGGAAVEKGLKELGAGAADVAQQVEQVKQRANAVAVNDNLTGLQQYGLTVMDGDGKTPGFLATRGKDAAAARADALSGMEKKATELEEGLANNEQKKLFRQHAQKVLLGERTRVEGHVLQQNQEAEVASLKGRMDVALNTIASNYTDAGGTATQTEKDVEQMLRAFHHGTPELADAKVQAFNQVATAARLDRYVKVKDWSGAQALFEKEKGKLGTLTDEYEGKIATLRVDAQAQDAVAQAVETARSPNGKVDIGKAEEAIGKLSGPLFDEAQKRMSHALTIETAKWKQQVDEHYSRAFGAYLAADGDLGAIDSEDKAWLIKNAPSDWNRILHEEYGGEARDRARASATRAAQHKRGGETDEQRQALIALKADINTNPEKYKTMTPEAFFSENRESLSAGGYSRAGELFAGVKKEKPQSGRVEFRDFVANEVKGTPLLRDKKQASTFQALMGDEFEAFKERNPDRKPTGEEMKKMRDSVWTTRETWFGLGKPEQVLKTRAPPGAAPTVNAGGTAKPPTQAAAPAGPSAKSKLAPGRYKTKDGKVVVVDALGNKKFE